MDFDVFISYASQDKIVADAACARLEQHGIRCWIAPRDIGAGVEWGEAIIDAIERCRVMVLIFSSKANESFQIRREIERAVSKGRPVLPMRIEDVMPSRSLEFFIGSVHWLDAMSPPVDQHLERLADAIKSLLPRPADPTSGASGWRTTQQAPTESQPRQPDTPSGARPLGQAPLGQAPPNATPPALPPKPKVIPTAGEAPGSGSATASARHPDGETDDDLDMRRRRRRVIGLTAAAIVALVALIGVLGLVDENQKPHQTAGNGTTTTLTEVDPGPTAPSQDGGTQADAVSPEQANTNGNIAYGRKDYAEALRWYQQAADQGNAAAQFALGSLYRNGLGTPRNYTRALDWYTKSAAQGNASAINDLGWLYQFGAGVPRDYRQAMTWYRKAAAQGNSTAQNNVGQLYHDGLGVPVDYAQALVWYRKSADQGNGLAENNIGWLYDDGQGVPQDYAQAMAWYRKAADHGNSAAENNIGRLYQNGLGVPVDYAQAMAWYRKAADQGEAMADYNIGRLYADGKGVAKDTAVARLWIEKAAAGDVADAKQWLAANPG
jgi:TPR repeat protein